MSEVRVCTLVLEYNYTKLGESLGTVWLYNGDGRPALSLSLPLNEISNWVKIAGPVDYELAETIHGNLKLFFKGSGIDVIDEGIAD